jgi:hypothetical protein
MCAFGYMGTPTDANHSCSGPGAELTLGGCQAACALPRSMPGYIVSAPPTLNLPALGLPALGLPALATGETTVAGLGGLACDTGRGFGPVGGGAAASCDPAVTSADGVDVSTITGLSGTAKWDGGVLARNGRVYAMPFNSPAVLVLDPSTATVNTTAMAGLTGSNKWNGGVLAANGKIYAMPFNAQEVLIIDPAAETADRTTMAGLSGAAKWRGGALAPNGKIYGMPYNAASVLIVDPMAATTDTATITGLSGWSKWLGAVLAPNGKIYGIPRDATAVLVINPTTNTAEQSSMVGLTGVAKWHGGVLARDGKIYGVPYSASSVLVIDPVSATTDVSSMVGLAGLYKWHGGVLAPNGKIYGIPYNSPTLLVINPVSLTTDVTTQVGASGASRFHGGVLAHTNGKFYGIPYHSSSVLIGIPSMATFTFLGCSDRCDASVPPVHGTSGNCTSILMTGTACAPSCDAGWTVSGYSTCNTGTLQAATCSLSPCVLPGGPTGFNSGLSTAIGFGYSVQNPPSLNMPALGLPSLGLPPTPVTSTVMALGAITCDSSFGFSGTAVATCSPGVGGGGTTDVSTFVGLRLAISPTNKWSGGVLAPNGKIYGIPYSSDAVLVIDTVAKTTDVSSMSGMLTSSKWAGGVLASNGRIYAIPFNAPNVLVINPMNNTVDATAMTGLAGSYKWRDGVLIPNGKIYGIPFNANSVLIIDPVTNTVDTTTITGLTGWFKWRGGVLAPNGRVYGVPHNSGSILVINTATNSADVSTLSGPTVAGSGVNKWAGGVLAPNGKIYCIPYRAAAVLIIDPVAITTDLTLLAGISGTNNWNGGVLGPNGNIYAIPAYSSSVLIIDPQAGTLDFTSMARVTGSGSKWDGGVLAPDGKIYGIPWSADAVLVAYENPRPTTFEFSGCNPPKCDGRSQTLVPTHASPTATAGSNASQALNQTMGSVLVFTCANGYGSTSTTNTVTYVCGPTGAFVATDTCQPIACDGRPATLPTPTNADITGVVGTAAQAAGQPFNSTLVWTCSPGYTTALIGQLPLPGASNFLIYTCDQSRTFTATEECTIVTCDGRSVNSSQLDTSAALSDSTASLAAAQSIGTSLHFNCSAAYTGSERYTCTGAGDFAKSSGSCTDIVCDGTPGAFVTPVVLNTTISTGTAARAPAQSYASTLIFSCNRGYAGTMTYACSGTGTFVAMGSCTPVTCNGSVGGFNLSSQASTSGVTGTAMQAAAQPYGSTLVFSCATGFYGSLQYICGQVGVFATSSNCVRITCNGTGIVSAQLNTSATHHNSTADLAPTQPFNSTLVFACGPGYLAGYLTLTCGQSGVFGTAESCTAVTCDGSTGAFLTTTNALGNNPQHQANITASSTAVRLPSQAYESTLIFSCGEGRVGYRGSARSYQPYGTQPLPRQAARPDYQPIGVIYTCVQTGVFETTDSCLQLTNVPAAAVPRSGAQHGMTYDLCTGKVTGEPCQPLCDSNNGWAAGKGLAATATGFVMNVSANGSYTQSMDDATLVCTQECVVNGLTSANTGGATMDPSCINGAKIPTGTLCALTCALGYSIAGTQPSCIGQNFNIGNVSCQPLRCNKLDFAAQKNLAFDAISASARMQLGTINDGFENGMYTNQAALNAGVGALNGRQFQCAAGFELKRTQYLCSTAGGMARFTGQLCHAISCANISNSGTPWCAFVGMPGIRAADTNYPDCSNSTFASHVWCVCAASVKARLSLQALPDAAIFAPKLLNGQCDSMFDTEACHHDNGNCIGVDSQCMQDVRSSVVPVCCLTSTCGSMPPTCSTTCANVIIPWWESCRYEPDQMVLPSWIWSGLVDSCQTVLANQQALPAGTCNDNGQQYSVGQKCDAACFCGDCSDEPLSCVYPLQKYPGSLCNYNVTSSSEYECMCNNGASLAMERVCDGVVDCGVGEDEHDDACASINALNTLELTLSTDLSALGQVGSAQRADFELAFRTDIATVGNVSSSRVIILGTRAGSVVVSFRVLDATAVELAKLQQHVAAGSMVVAGLVAPKLTVISASALSDWGTCVSQDDSRGRGATAKCRQCVQRWQQTVVPRCAVGTASPLSAPMCVKSCVDPFVDWFVDCKAHVSNTTLLNTTMLQDTNAMFMCCLPNKTGTVSGNCVDPLWQRPRPDPLVSRCSATAGATYPLLRLGDGTCDHGINCAEYALDGADCARTVVLAIPFSAQSSCVCSMFGPREFVAAVRGCTPSPYIGEHDVETLEFSQRLTSTFQLTAGGLNSATAQSNRATLQIINALAAWLDIPSSVISVSVIDNVAASVADAVTIGFLVVAPKNVASTYEASDPAADLIRHLNAAQPRGFATIGQTDTLILAAKPLVSASIRIRVSVSETKYLFHQRAEAISLDIGETQRYDNMVADITALLQNENNIKAALDGSSTCTDPTCVFGLTANTSAMTVEGHSTSPPPPATEEAVFALGIIVAIFFGGVTAVCCLLCCAFVCHRRRLHRRIVVIGEDGPFGEEFKEIEAVEREVLMQILEEYVDEQEGRVEESQLHAIATMTSVKEAYAIIEGEELSWDHTGAVQDQSGRELRGVALAAAQDLAAVRGRTRAETRARMDQRRETLRAQQLQALSEAAAVGVAEEDGDEQLDGYVEEELALLFGRLDEVELKAAAEEDALELRLDHDELAVAQQKYTEVAAAQAAAPTVEEKQRLLEQFRHDMQAESARLAQGRTARREKLYARLARAKRSVQHQVAVELQPFVGAGLIERQVRDAPCHSLTRCAPSFLAPVSVRSPR